MKERKLKIAWCSNAEWSPSGYSQQTVEMKRSFLDNGWNGTNFSLINMFGQMGGKFVDRNGITNYPLIDHTVGSDAQVLHGRDFNADVVIGLYDIWPQNPQDLSQINRWIPWAPIDYDPVPKPILNNLRFANRIIAMSKFGQKQIQNNGFSSTYIPHGVNTKIFFPMDKKQRKIDLGMDPNTFIVGMISANKEQFNPRKSFQQAMDSFKMFLEKRPNSLLYIHTDPDFPGGFPLKQYADFLGIAPRVAFPDRYKQKYNTSKEDMNLIYNSFDMLWSASSTEGFCIPVVEAQACGVPVIVNSWTSMPELIQDGITGYVVEHTDPIYYPIGSFVAFPSAKDAFDKMMLVTQMPQSVSESARKWAVDNYDHDMLFQTKWLPFLGKLEKEIYG